MISWRPRQVINLAYAVLAERADADDRAELALLAHASDKGREELCRHRADLDVMLERPIGRVAEGERALIRELGGVA